MHKTVAISVFVLFVLGSSACTGTKEAWLEQGNRNFAAGKYEDASLNYRKAIQKSPEFGEAYYRLGLAAIKLNQAQEAYQSLYRAVQLLPGNIDAKEKLGETCLSYYLADSTRPQALYEQITELSNELLAANSNSYEGLILSGYLASTDGKLKDAIALFHRALKIDSSNPGVVTQLAHTLIQDGEIAEGEKLAAGLIAQKTSYGQAYDLLYDFYLSVNRAADADTVLKAKAINNPKNEEYALQLARHYRRLDKRTEMQAALQRLLDDPTSFPKARILVGDFYLGRREYTEAIRYYQDDLRGNTDAQSKLTSQKRIVIALVGQGRNEDASELAGQVVKENPNDFEGLRLHARTLLDSGNRANADVAINELQTLAGKNPNDASLLLQLGQAYRLKGELARSREQLVAAVNRRPELISARYELGEVSLMLHRASDAVQQANKILELQPTDRRARLLRTAGWIEAGNAASARQELQQLSKDDPRDSEPRVQLGLLQVAEQKYSEAIDTLKQRKGSDPRVYAGIAAAYLHQKQFDNAREVLDEGLKNLPDSEVLIEQLADTEALAGRYDLAIGYLQKLIATDPKSASLRLRIGEVYGLKGDHENEIANFQQAAQSGPEDLTASLSLAGALAHAGRTNEARVQFRRLVKMHPESAPALNNAAYFLADNGGDLDEALRLAQEALQKVPGQPGFSDTVGYIYLKKGLSDSAVVTFSNLTRKYPAFAGFRYHLGLALYQKGDRTAARKELQAALSDHPSPQDQQRIRELLQKLS
jgi:tetratricopeptide (TPR) repeat protein